MSTAPNQNVRADFDWDVMPRSTFVRPTGYYNVKIEEHDVVHSEKSGIIGFTAVGRIANVGDATEIYEDQPVYFRFYIGHEEDPDGEDPVTWSRGNKAVGSRIAVENMGNFLVATGLTRGEGRGVHPRQLWDDIDGCELCVQMGTRVRKDTGDEEQTYKFFKKGDRVPGLIGATPTPARRAAAPQEPQAARPVHAVDEDEAPRRRRG